MSGIAPQQSDHSLYVTLRDETATSPPHADPQYAPAYAYYSDDSEDEPEAMPGHAQPPNFWSKFRGSGTIAEQPQSGYLTLIPLSDSRLKPQHTKLVVGAVLVLAALAACFVYFFVARGVTVGTITVVNSTISFNFSAGTYELLLWSQLLVYNPNYAPVLLTGRINVLFYDKMAGFLDLQPVVIPARAQPEVVIVDINGSHVPPEYQFSIYTLCFTFPKKLIFFMEAELNAQYLGTTYALPKSNSYAIVGCQDDLGLQASGT